MAYNREYSKKYYQEHREKILESHRNDEDYKRRHVECQQAYIRKMQRQNPEQYEELMVRNRIRKREYMRNYYRERIKSDPVRYEKYKEYMRNYHKRKKEQKKLNNEILALTSQLEMI